METSLHRELKHLYAETAEQTEVAVDGFRIDALGKGCLVEIQHGSLAAIRDKVRRLLESHRVLVVKPIILQRRLLKWSTVDAPPTSRLSPKRGSPLDLFDELVFFTRVFPHPNLTIEAPLVEIEEWRRPAPVPKRRRRWQRDYVVEDRKLVTVRETLRVHTAQDLLSLLSVDLPARFTTADLSLLLGVARWRAQRIAYCLRHAGICESKGKSGRSWLYDLVEKPRPPKGRSRSRKRA
jgi:hypothetical protein